MFTSDAMLFSLQGSEKHTFSSSAMAENAEGLTKEQMVELAEDIREDAQWLIGMVENLLSVTKIDSGDVKLIKTPVVLEELIDSVLIRFRKRYPKQEVQVQIPDDFIVMYILFLIK